MDATLHALARILLNAIPTSLILLFLIVYLKAVFFGPMASMIKRRYEETEGARQAAEESMRRAEQRIAEYESQLRAARGDIYSEQSRLLKEAEHQNALQLEKSRREAEAHVARVTADLRAQADEARRTLDAQSGELADRIVTHILEGRVA